MSHVAWPVGGAWSGGRCGVRLGFPVVAGRVCWFCERYSNMRWVDGISTTVPHGYVDVMGAFACDSCGHLSLALARIYQHEYGHNVQISLIEAEDSIQWLPPKALSKDFADVPSAIAAAASEVHSCLSINANRAAIALARAVVEATAKEKNVTKGNLQDKINALADQGLIRDHTRQVAHEVRLDGNSIAHGDLATEAPEAEEAADIVALMDELLEEVYQQPARVARVKANRERRKGS